MDDLAGMSPRQIEVAREHVAGITSTRNVIALGPSRVIAVAQTIA